MTHVPPSQSFTLATGLLPVTRDCPGLGTALLFNSARRAFAMLEPVPQNVPDWPSLMSEIAQAGHLLATDLLVPEAQLGCQLLERAVTAEPCRVRQAYRCAYWAELAQNQAIYLAFLEQCDVPPWVLQSLRTSCAQEQLLQRFEQALARISPEAEGRGALVQR